jgi:hypothetical protein
MARRKQDKIKNYCGDKQARKEANAKCMAGELEPKSAHKRAALKMSEEDVVVDF